MLIGYCRSMPTVRLDPTDIEGGGTQNQESVLRAAGCKKFFIDSNKTAQKLVMREAALDFIRENDVLVVTSIDRVARSSCELMELMQQLANHGATLRVLMFGGLSSIRRIPPPSQSYASCQRFLIGRPHSRANVRS
jgi:DNA invertase Pin-like site-specific DNA recombinase